MKQCFFFRNFIESIFSEQTLLYFVDIVTSRRGECLERLETMVMCPVACYIMAMCKAYLRTQ